MMEGQAISRKMPHLLVIPMTCESRNESKSSKNSQFRSVIDQTNDREIEACLGLNKPLQFRLRQVYFVDKIHLIYESLRESFL